MAGPTKEISPVISARVRPMEFLDANASAEVARVTGATGSWPNFTRPYMREYPEDMRRGYMRSQLLARLDDHQLVEVIEITLQSSETLVAGVAHWRLPRPAPISGNAGEAETKKDMRKEFARIAIKAWLPTTDRTVDTYRDELLDNAALELISEHKVPEKYMELYHLAILPQFQRRGYGRLLMRSGLKLARDNHWPVALLAVPEAVGMYTAIGFREVLRKDVVDERGGGAEATGKARIEIVLMMMNDDN